MAFGEAFTLSFNSYCYLITLLLTPVVTYRREKVFLHMAYTSGSYSWFPVYGY